MWIRTEKRPLYNAADQVIGVLAIATDITAQKDNERLTIENNAVDALDGHPGKVTLSLDADDALVKIFIRDNGKGMSETLVEKIINNIAITEGKKDGHGLGLMQAREMLQRNQGTFNIDSELGKGTTIRLIFPRSKAPAWIAETITVSHQDTVVILDDEPTIHGAWDAYFATQAPGIRLRHFKRADEAFAFLHGFTEKEHVLLLIDYELLNQPYNGLDVIEQTQIKRAVLVTSHYDAKPIQEQAVKLSVTILPKHLATYINILYNY